MKTDIAPAAPRSPLGREKLEGQNQAAVSTVTKVQFHWNAALGINEGYDLWMGKSWIHFPGPEWRLEEAINPPITSWADKRVVNWTVTWNRPNGRPSIIDLKENEMNPDTSILDDALGRAKTESADHVPTPPEKRPRVANGAAPFIRNHFKLHYKVEGQALNAFLKTVYMGMEPEQYIRANGVDAAYRVMDAYDAGQKSNGKPIDEKPQTDADGVGAAKLQNGSNDPIGHAQNSPNEAAGATETKTEPTPQTETTTPATPEIPGANPANVIQFPKLPTTLTGIGVLDIPKRLNEHLPPQAYKAIEFGQMTGKTDIDGDCVRDRFDQVFGPMGIGWRISPNPVAGRVEYHSEIRPVRKKGEIVRDQTTSETITQIWHIVTLVAHTFQYALLMPDGSIVWTDASTTSDQHDNMDEQYAYRGAMTSFMKQVYRLMGGMNHVVYNQYTHVHAQKELARRSA